MKHVAVILVGDALVHHMLSVSLASSPDDDVVLKNVAGFIVMSVITEFFVTLLSTELLFI